jgi:S-adenosylmethionine decarboxylase
MRMVKMLHILAELYGCPADKLKSVGSVKKILNQAVAASKLKKIYEAYHQFNPHGTTGFILLETSHISIHTWPEKNYAAIDVFTCGDPAQGKKAIAVCVKRFGSETVKIKEIERGA